MQRMNNDSKIFAVETVSSVCTKPSTEKRPNKGKHVYRFKESKSRTVLKKGWNRELASPPKADDDSSYIDGFYGILALATCTMACFTITLLPAHNAITNPEYWYEIIFSLSSWCLFNGITHIIAAKSIINPFNKTLMSVIIYLLVPFTLTGILAVGFIHLIWSLLLGYFEPFPFRWWLIAYFCIMVFFIRMWYEIPRQKREDTTFRKHCKAYIYLSVWTIAITVQLNCMSAVFGRVPLELQWLLLLYCCLKINIFFSREVLLYKRIISR